MKQTTISAVILAVFLSVAGCTSQRYTQYHRERPPVADTLAMMKKQDVISLTKAGVSDSLIMTMLATSHSWFQLKTQDVLDLKNAGVSDGVINAMIVSNEPPQKAIGTCRMDITTILHTIGIQAIIRTGIIRRFTLDTVTTSQSTFPGRGYFGGYGYRGGWGGGRRR